MPYEPIYTISNTTSTDILGGAGGTNPESTLTQNHYGEPFHFIRGTMDVPDEELYQNVQALQKLMRKNKMIQSTRYSHPIFYITFADKRIGCIPTNVEDCKTIQEMLARINKNMLDVKPLKNAKSKLLSPTQVKHILSVFGGLCCMGIGIHWLREDPYNCIFILLLGILLFMLPSWEKMGVEIIGY